MVRFSFEILDRIMERVGPYLSDLGTMRNELEGHIGREISEIIINIEHNYHRLSDVGRKTDYRIILNAMSEL